MKSLPHCKRKHMVDRESKTKWQKARTHNSTLLLAKFVKLILHPEVVVVAYCCELWVCAIFFF